MSAMEYLVLWTAALSTPLVASSVSHDVGESVSDTFVFLLKQDLVHTRENTHRGLLFVCSLVIFLSESTTDVESLESPRPHNFSTYVTL